ncbi:hypothetical protein [Aristophania vespae]|uniref:hypothetical protein n=1 Tax=Aristophania vespae TaxID=2697033 RepID=UPI0023511C41|nr:hypothetical protein [Aristophania vespae]UMM63143.1 hypothetical protein DM15PD_00980 [Aristophania vespae]
MRVWTRQFQSDGTRKWVAVTGNQAIIAWLQNNLLLQLGESPFYADKGLPVTQSLISRIWPDYYLNQLQEFFRDYVSTIQITRDTSVVNDGLSYKILVIFKDGSLWTQGLDQFNQSFSQTGPYHGNI